MANVQKGDFFFIFRKLSALYRGVFYTKGKQKMEFRGEDMAEIGQMVPKK